MIKLINKYKIEIIVFLAFVIIRLPGLGHDVFNTDVWKWKSRIYDFGTGVFELQFEKTLQKYHPGVTLMWVGTAGVKINSFYHKIVLGTEPADNLASSVFLLHAIQKVLLVIVLGVLVSIIFHQLKYLFGIRYGLITISLFMYEPFYLALTRVLHLEGLMTTFMIISLLFMSRFMREKSTKHLVLSAFFGGLAFLTKTSSLFLLPYFGLILLINTSENRLKNTFLSFSKWIVVAFITFVALWPVMYVKPVEAFQYLGRGIFTIGVEREHPQLYFGKWVEDPGPSFYLVVLGFRLSLIALLGFFGTIFTWKKLSKDQNKKQFLINLGLFIFFYILMLTIPSKKLDRYILPTIMVMILMAGFYFELLTEKFKKVFVYSGLSAFILFGIIYYYPNYFSYYSPIFGGLRGGIYAIEPKWMIGQWQIADHFKTHERYKSFVRFPEDMSLDSQLYKKDFKEKLSIAFQEKYYTQMWPFIMEIGGRATIKDLTPQAIRTNFFVYPVYDDDSYKEDRFKLEKVDVIKLRGVNLYNVYQRVEKP